MISEEELHKVLMGAKASCEVAKKLTKLTGSILRYLNRELHTKDGVFFTGLSEEEREMVRIRLLEWSFEFEQVATFVEGG